MLFEKIDSAIRRLNHKRIDYFRSAALCLSRMIWDNKKNVIPFSDDLNHILVLRMDDKLGDAVVSSGFLFSLKKSFPECRLTILTGPHTAHYYQSLGFVDEVISIKKKWAETFRAHAELKKYDYKFIVNTSHILNPKVVYLLSRLKAFRKVGFANTDYNLFTDFADYDSNCDHATIRYKKVLEIVGAHECDLSYRVQVDPVLNSEVLKSLKIYRDQSRPVIILNSFAGARLRNFNYQTTTEIIKRLQEKLNAVVVSVAGRGDHRIVKEWREKALIKDWLQFENYARFEENIALTNNADLIITPDTAWVHIASALNQKLLAVYRSDENQVEKNQLIWAPQARHEMVITRGSAEEMLDINQINLDELVEKAEKLLKNT